MNGAKHQESLGKRLKRLRTEKNLSVKDVAEALEVPVTTYREWENERKIVGEPYPALAKLLGVSVYTLITGEKSKGTEALASLDVIRGELAKITDYLFSRE